MKKTATLFALLAVMIAAVASARAQDQEPFRETYTKSFPTVWKSIKQALTEVDCLVEHEKYSETDDGTYKGKLTSVFCVLASGEDTTENVMERYSKRIPYIRGAVWESVRMQYIFYVTEKDDGSVQVLLKGEISGFENYVTNQFHYFDSNGTLERQMMERLNRIVAAAGDE